VSFTKTEVLPAAQEKRDDEPIDIAFATIAAYPGHMYVVANEVSVYLYANHRHRSTESGDAVKTKKHGR
jgi:hypothetical protein